MRQQFCRACGQWHNEGEKPYECYPVITGQSDRIPLPNIISDTIEPIQHPIDGRYYSSKSTFSRITKDAGAIEVGNDPSRLRPKERARPDKRALRDSIEKAKARYIRGERV